MRLCVREQGDEVHVDVDGVAGRQDRILQALNECQRRAGVARPSAAGAVAIRAGANRMRIRFRGGDDGQRVEAEAIYQCLREVLVENAAPAGERSAIP